MVDSVELATLSPGYSLRRGSAVDRALLLQCMRRTYRELYPEHSFEHLAQTLDAYFSPQTPLWWVEKVEAAPAESALNDQARQGLVGRGLPAYVGCLWMGTAVDQVSGLRHAHIFLLYVQPEHRRQGLGRALMLRAEDWAKERGDRQISLQVFNHNAAALELYQGLGYQVQSIALIKPLESSSG